MKAHREIEIKLPVSDPARIRRRLRALGFRVVRPRQFESNTLFDAAGQPLRRARSALRLRREGKQWLLTFKGPPHPSARYKIRKEVECAVSNGGALQQILELAGWRVVFRYEKYRTVFRPPGAPGEKLGGLLMYDRTPIGDFIELEGPPRWIDRVADCLGYTARDYITASYATLFRHSRGGKRAANDMVF